MGFRGGSDRKESACSAGDQVQSLGQKDPLENGMATYSSILAWRIPWTEEPGGLQSMGSDMAEPLILIYFSARVLFFFFWLFTMEHFKQTYRGENTSIIHLYMPVTQLQQFFSQNYLIYTYIYIAFIIEICKQTHRK